MFCTKCGYNVKDGAKFCTNCGCVIDTNNSIKVSKKNVKTKKTSFGLSKFLIPILLIIILVGGFLLVKNGTIEEVLNNNIKMHISKNENETDVEKNEVYDNIDKKPSSMVPKMIEQNKLDDDEEMIETTIEETLQNNIQEESKNEYIIPDSSVRRITEKDVEGLSKEELSYAINEIYARHGRKFVKPEIQNYFLSKSWYHPLIEAKDFQDGILSDIEYANITFIQILQSMMP